MTFKPSLHLIAGLLLLAGLGAAQAAEPVAAYPASLKSDCTGDCRDTLRDNHDLMFISRLSFPLGSAMLSREAQNELLRMLVELESFAVIRQVQIIGHADPSGPEEFNRWITEVRARRVEDYLRQSGVDPRMIAVRGAGSSEPLAGAIDDSEHRRIELRITLQPFL